MMLAVLERKAGFEFGGLDVFVNVAGGVRIDEPALDLAVVLAVASSAKRRAVDPAMVVFGEIGLAGEVRAVPRVDARLKEVEAMGFRVAVGPGEPSRGLHVVRSLVEALEFALR